MSNVSNMNGSNEQNYYDITQAKLLVTNVENETIKVGQSLAAEYRTIVNVLRTEWKGNDESAFEAELIDLCEEIYGNTKKVTNAVISHVIESINAYQKYQTSLANNMRPGGAGSYSYVEFNPDRQNLQTFSYYLTNCSTPVKSQDGFSWSGLHDKNSGTLMTQAGNTFVTQVKGTTDYFSGNAYIDTAFKTSSQADTSMGIKPLLDKVGTAMGALANRMKKFMDSEIPELVKGYTSASEKVTTAGGDLAGDAATKSSSYGGTNTTQNP